MMTAEQIELINEKASIIEPCIEFARKFLVLPTIDVYFDDCPSHRFKTLENASECNTDEDGNGIIYINGPWFVDRINEHQDDVEFFIFHELRHIHQKNQIRLLSTGYRTRESIKIVEAWKDGFKNYRRNEGGESQEANVRQEVEIDANAYGIILEILYRNGRKPLLSIPDDAFDLANDRLQHYIDNLPEFKNVREGSKSGSKVVKQQPVVKDKKIGRNAPCPCGSGKKYKYCCGR